jgi:hypothetical protein
LKANNTIQQEKNIMINTSRKIVLVLLSIGFLLPVQLWAAGLGNNIAVRLVGTGVAYGGNDLFDDFGLDPVGALCFDVDLVDIKTGNVIGAASDCLSDISGDPVEGLALTGTTFFYFPGGNLVTRGLTTVQPTLHGSPDFTHITGAIPGEGENSVVYGDGKFAGAEGPARLSGTVNLSELDSDEKIKFDCVFVIDAK